MRRRRLLWLLLSALPLAAAAGGASADAFKSGVFDPPREAPELKLSGSDGNPLTLRRYRGKVVALAFGFTHCQRVCPVTLANLLRATKVLGDAARELQVVFVTVDPARDDAARLREYLGMFDKAFLGATGTPAQLEAVRTAYGVTAKRDVAVDPTLGYQVHHSSSLYLIDRAGKLRLLVPFGAPAEDIAHDVRLLLQK